MQQATNHLDFIVAAYAAAIAVVGALIAWVTFDYRAQLHNLSDLEKRGFTRRSTSIRTESTIAKAKEEA
jgi:heme exporter protein CcmD